MKKLRIAYGRIMQESNAFSPLETTLADFERTHLHEGADLARRASDPKTREVDGYLMNAELSGFHDAVRRWGGERVETVPLVSAWAISGGPVAADALAYLIGRLTTTLRAAMPVDGVFLALHGAMGAMENAERTTQGDPEARIIEAVREVVGPDVPIAATFDLHGLLTRDKMAALDFLAAYQTNPHRDHRATGRRAGRMLIDAVLGKARPARAWRSLPVVLGGGTGIDFLPPVLQVFWHLRRLQRRRGVRDISLFMCHPWNNHPELGWSIAVFADSEALAEEVADEIAARAWEIRHVKVPSFPTGSEGIARIRKERLRRRLGTICVCDVSDVVGAGAAGENTNLLKLLHDEGRDLRVYVPLRDAVAVAEVMRHAVGERVTVAVGGRIDPSCNPQLTVTGRLLFKGEESPFGRRVALDLSAAGDGRGPQLVLTEGAPLVMKPEFYREVGLDPWKADACIVKAFFPFRLFFAAENRLSLYVETRGRTDFSEVMRLETVGPVFPQVDLEDWRPEDRRRRGLAEAR